MTDRERVRGEVGTLILHVNLTRKPPFEGLQEGAGRSQALANE